jgi:error-prone DNA polymerase
MSARYAELHCLSNFTFLRGASHAQELVETAIKLGYEALAITDECSLAGVVRAHAAAKNTRLRLIIGAEFRLDDDLRFVLLAQNREGYGNLSDLITRGRRNAKKGEYRLSRKDIGPGLEHCLALWLPPSQPQPADASWLAGCFPGRTWIAVELLARGGDWDRIAALQDLGRRAGLPCVACGDVHMHVRGRRALQDVLTAIRLGMPVAQAGCALYPSGERHLRRYEILERIYPQALLQETVRIAERCDFSLKELRYEYPEEIVPDGETPARYLRRLTEEGLRKRYPHGIAAEVQEQAGKELALIAELGYEAFFLTVYDVVRYAREQKILCQGRGSAANSVVCFALGITEVDPSRTNLLFERFISKERNEPPDIDVDFEHERREEVIQHIYRKYGRDRAALAATVVSYRTRSAFRDVGKALGLDAVQLDRISSSFVWWDRPDERAARLREAGFDPQSPVIRKLVALTDTLTGFPRHLSQHVGGFVISRGPLSQLVPTENAAMPDRTNIQWDKNDLEELGLLKVDVLALGMLSAIRRALEMVNRRRGTSLSMADILETESGPESVAVYDMLCKADSIGIFQIESRAQMSMLPRLKPRCYYDLVIEVAIVRPGPIQGGMVHPYLNNRKKKPEDIKYSSPALQKVLERTLGVPIFQEQVMQIAIVAAGFSPGKADQLRRAMAAWKKRGGLEPFKEDLVRGMLRNGYDEKFALQIFEQIKGFGEYGFPESHSASFALLVYVSSWLKRYEHAAFTCALLNSQPMGFYAPAQLVQDAQRHGVEVRAVDVMKSEWECTLEEREARGVRREAKETDSDFTPHPSRLTPHDSTRPAVRLGLRMVSGLSGAAAGRLVKARDELLESFRASRIAPDPSPLTPHALPDLEELALRAKLSRKDMNALAAAGSLGSLAGHRRNAAWLVAGIEKRLPVLASAPIVESAPALAAPTEGQDILADYASLGLTLGRHPLALLRPRLKKLSMITAEELGNTPTGTPVHVAGLVTCRQHPGTAKGVIFVTLEDETGQINVVVWERLSQKQRRPLLGARLLGVDGILERESGVTHLIAQRLTDHSALIGDLDAHSRDFH